MQLEIIGEAANALSAEATGRFPETAFEPAGVVLAAWWDEVGLRRSVEVPGQVKDRTYRVHQSYT